MFYKNYRLMPAETEDCKKRDPFDRRPIGKATGVGALQKTLQETLGKESESKDHTELEDMLRKFLKQRVDARETQPVAEREVASYEKPEKKQKERPSRSTTTRARTSPYPTADRRPTKREGDKRDRQQNSPSFLRSTKDKSKKADVSKWRNVI